MITCPLAQFLLLALPKGALHAEIVMLWNSDIADEMLVGEYLRAEAEELMRGERTLPLICGLCVMRVGMLGIVGKPRLMSGKVSGVSAEALLALKS